MASGSGASAAEPSAPGALRLLRNLDLVALALALPIFLVAGLPLTGYATAAAVWLVQRAIQAAIERRVGASPSPRAVVGMVAGGAIGRAWLAALAVLALGLADEQAGLAAVLLILALFTVYFTAKLIQGAPAGR